MHSETLLILERNYDRHLDMLRFIETKCGTLMAATSAASLFLVTNIKAETEPAERLLIFVPLIFFALTFIILAVSFLPFTKRPETVSDRHQPHGAQSAATIAESQTIFFFGDTKHMTATQILRHIEQKTGTSIGNATLEAELAEQICVVARIIQVKTDFFRAAVWTTISGLTTPIGAAFVWVIVRIRDWRFSKTGEVA